MLSPAPSDASEPGSLAVARASIEVVLSEDGATPLSLVLPPYEDIREIDTLRGQHFSIRDWSGGGMAYIWGPLKHDYKELIKKQARLGKSHVLLNRLANIAAIDGDRAVEEEHLRAALEVKDFELGRIRLIENLLATHRGSEASQLLAKEDLAASIYANLRIASGHAIAGDIETALTYVYNAISIDPLDFGARLFEGCLFLHQGDNERAILSFRIASQKRSNSAVLHTNTAVAYVRLNRPERAAQCLRKAVAIDPLNVNAVTFLADLAFAQHRDEDAIPALRYLLRFEQKNAGTWARLARALLRLGESAEAVAAIKRQASLENSTEVWNNLGVAYYAAGDSKKSLESFTHAMKISDSDSSRGFCIAVKNVAALISKKSEPEAVLKFIDAAVTPESTKTFLEDNDAGSIFMVRIHCLVKLRRTEEMLREAEWLLAQPNINTVLACRIATGLIAAYSLNEKSANQALPLALHFTAVATDLLVDEEVKTQLLNNIAFVHAERGDLQQAEATLQLISNDIHKNAYVTATSGLLHLKRGHVARADALYQEALKLSTSPMDKARIRQKWNLEIGKGLLEVSQMKAIRLLTRARDEKDGEEGLSAQASRLLRAIAVK